MDTDVHTGVGAGANTKFGKGRDVGVGLVLRRQAIAASGFEAPKAAIFRLLGSVPRQVTR
jgi:hypothetical protein